MEKFKLSRIKLKPDNPRKISSSAMEKLMSSIKEFPRMLELRPVVYDDNTMHVVGGNQRLKALRKLGYKEVPMSWVKSASNFTEEELRRFVAVDNASFGEWDMDVLLEGWNKEELEEWGLDIDFLEDMEEDTPVLEDNVSDEENIKVDVIEGDLIEFETQYGVHRLMCGDSTCSDTLSDLINGNKMDMIFTDPPYEIDVDYASLALCVDNAHVFIFNNDRALVRQLNTSPFDFKKFFVFNHSACAIPQEGGNECFLDHILISHEVVGKPLVRFNKGKGLRTVIKGEYRRSKIHKHEKPAALLSDIITSYTDAGHSVIDFFAGSGSLLSVCHQLKRICYSIELDPKNCQQIINRMIDNYDIIVKINGRQYEQEREN